MISSSIQVLNQLSFSFYKEETLLIAKADVTHDKVTQRMCSFKQNLRGDAQEMLLLFSTATTIGAQVSERQNVVSQNCHNMGYDCIQIKPKHMQKKE